MLMGDTITITANGRMSPMTVRKAELLVRHLAQRSLRPVGLP